MIRAYIVLIKFQLIPQRNFFLNYKNKIISFVYMMILFLLNKFIISFNSLFISIHKIIHKNDFFYLKRENYFCLKFYLNKNKNITCMCFILNDNREVFYFI